MDHTHRPRLRAELASYCLLVPRTYDSGEAEEGHTKGRQVVWVGRRTLTWAFIQAAHGAVRTGGRFQELFDRRTNGGRKDRNRGYIAVAHELCREVDVCWRKDVDDTEDRLARPGQKE